MKRIIAIDFGLKRIGIAISDSGQKIAFPLETVPGGAEAVLNIKKALKNKIGDIERILLGLPVQLNGKEGDMAGLVRTFAKSLEEAFHLPVELIDERFTSRMADQNLREIHLNRKERTAKLDTAAAAILLQAYLDGKQ
jgi:putative Holliday junction resolvase